MGTIYFISNKIKLQKTEDMYKFNKSKTESGIFQDPPEI